MTIEQEYYSNMYDRQCELKQAMSIMENEAEVQDLEYEIMLEEMEEARQGKSYFEEVARLR